MNAIPCDVAKIMKDLHDFFCGVHMFQKFLLIFLGRYCAITTTG
jgi:hypothetical protein